MPPHCRSRQLEFQALGSRRLIGEFDAGHVTSDGGAVLLRELDAKTGIVSRFAACFADFRDQRRVEHSVEQLVRQRAFGLCLGYEDVSDHDTLRDDPALAAAVGQPDVLGEHRRRASDVGHALAGKSTLNRLELAGKSIAAGARYKKLIADDEAMEKFFVEEFIDAHKHKDMPRVTLDFDPTDIQLHGKQEGRFFHGYYGHHCYLPMMVFCGDDLLMSRLRRADIDGSAGTVDMLGLLVPMLRKQWPSAQIVLRADSGFAREAIFAWCEANDVEYVIGLSRNKRLQAAIAQELEASHVECLATGKPSRRFKDLLWRTVNSWSKPRRVVGKGEHIPGKANPRFIVTSLGVAQEPGKQLYEDFYCQRGEAENRIREHQQDLFGHQASCSTMRGNQIRLWLSSLAYTLVNELRREGLRGTELERAQAATIRSRLLKIGALVLISRRRVKLSFSSSHPMRQVFVRAFDAIATAWEPAPT